MFWRQLISSLPSKVKYSALALAVDEHRAWFPGTDLNVTHRKPFRGTHSDIGGGFWNHDVADAVLQWMTGHAQAAGVSIDISGLSDFNPHEDGIINPKADEVFLCRLHTR